MGSSVGVRHLQPASAESGGSIGSSFSSTNPQNHHQLFFEQFSPQGPSLVSIHSESNIRTTPPKQHGMPFSGSQLTSGRVLMDKAQSVSQTVVTGHSASSTPYFVATSNWACQAPRNVTCAELAFLMLTNWGMVSRVSLVYSIASHSSQAEPPFPLIERHSQSPFTHEGGGAAKQLRPLTIMT